MPQLAYNFLMTQATAGEIYDIGFDNVLTPVATQIIPFGVGVAKVIGQDQAVRLPHQDIVTLTASVPLVTSNSTVVTLNGIALTPVVFNTDNATTLGLIAALIAAQDNIASAVSNGTDAIVITASQGFAVTATAVTTLGAGQPTWTSVRSNDNVFYGISVFIQNKMNLYDPSVGSVGGPVYAVGDPVSTMTRGRIWVVPETTVTSDSPVYWRVIPSMAFPVTGTFRGDSDGGNAILVSSSLARWWIGGSAGTLAVLDINLP